MAADEDFDSLQRLSFDEACCVDASLFPLIWAFQGWRAPGHEEEEEEIRVDWWEGSHDRPGLLDLFMARPLSRVCALLATERDDWLEEMLPPMTQALDPTAATQDHFVVSAVQHGSVRCLEVLSEHGYRYTGDEVELLRFAISFFDAGVVTWLLDRGYFRMCQKNESGELECFSVLAHIADMSSEEELAACVKWFTLLWGEGHHCEGMLMFLPTLLHSGVHPCVIQEVLSQMECDAFHRIHIPCAPLVTPPLCCIGAVFAKSRTLEPELILLPDSVEPEPSLKVGIRDRPSRPKPQRKKKAAKPVPPPSPAPFSFPQTFTLGKRSPSDAHKCIKSQLNLLSSVTVLPQTPLCWAVKENNVAAVEMLLGLPTRAPSFVGKKDMSDCVTFAIQNKRPDVLRLFITTSGGGVLTGVRLLTNS